MERLKEGHEADLWQTFFSMLFGPALSAHNMLAHPTQAHQLPFVRTPCLVGPLTGPSAPIVTNETMQVIMIFSCQDVFAGEEHELMFVRYLVHPTLVVDAKSPMPDGSLVPGQGFLVHRERDCTPVTLQPLVWEEMHEFSVTNPSKRPRKATKQGPRRTSSTQTNGTYAVIGMGAVRGEALVFENERWGPGHFLLFDLNDHPTPSQLKEGNLPLAWR